MHGIARAFALICSVGLLGACVGSEPLPRTGLPGTSESAVVGAAGGTFRLADTVLVVPEGALADETEIRVTVTGRQAPSAFAAYSPIWSFEPAGLVFDLPVTVSLPHGGSASSATVFFSARHGDQYVALRTAVEGDRVSARIDHFGEAFAGSGCPGDDCCDAANGELDILLMIDNSNSMQEEQAALAEQLPRMARVLATGDLDGDGEQDFPALESVRLGVVSSDMGAGGFSIATCDEPGGDDAALRVAGNADLPGCDASYPAFATLGADESDAGVDAFVEHVRCVGLAGTGGCGFEQQLEAVLKAVTPSTSPIRFEGGAPGNGDGLNAGFLRGESIVAFVLLTDEEDCSTADPSLFDPSRTDMEPLNLRCALRPGSLHPVTRYVDGLRELRSDPADVVFALVAGVPVDLVADPDAIDYGAILSDPRMATMVSPVEPNTLVPSCSTERGVAYPPRRMVEAAQGFGANGLVQSICQADFTPVVAAILERVAARARGECVED